MICKQKVIWKNCTKIAGKQEENFLFCNSCFQRLPQIRSNMKRRLFRQKENTIF